MKLKFFTLSTIILAFACSCSSSSTTKKEPTLIKPTQTKIKGDLKDCFEVIDKPYEVKWDRGEKIITIEIMRTDAELPYNRDDFDVYKNKGDNPKEKVAGFGIEFIDSLGNVVKTITPSESSLYSDKMVAALRLLPGESGSVSWGTYNDWDWSITGFRIVSSVETNTKEKGDLFDRAFEKWENDDNSKDDDSKDDNEDDVDDFNDAIETTKKAADAAKEIIEAEKKLLDLF